MLEIEKWFNPPWLTFIIFHHHFVYLIIEKFVFQVELVVWSGVSPRFFWLSRWTCSYDDLPTWVTRCAPLYVTVHLDGFPVTKRNVRLGGEGLKSEDIVATTSRDSYILQCHHDPLSVWTTVKRCSFCFKYLDRSFSLFNLKKKLKNIVVTTISPFIRDNQNSKFPFF